MLCMSLTKFSNMLLTSGPEHTLGNTTNQISLFLSSINRRGSWIRKLEILRECEWGYMLPDWGVVNAAVTREKRGAVWGRRLRWRFGRNGSKDVQFQGDKRTRDSRGRNRSDVALGFPLWACKRKQKQYGWHSTRWHGEDIVDSQKSCTAHLSTHSFWQKIQTNP